MNDTTKQKWVINGMLAVIVVLLAAFAFRSGLARVHAAGEGWATDNMIAMNTNGGNEEVLVLVDTSPQRQSIMVYRILTGNLRLLSARSYKYDVEIEDSSEVKEMAGKGITWFQAKDAYEKAQKSK